MTSLEVEPAPSPAAQTDLRTTQVVQHLLWHKATLDHDEDGSRISGFVDMVMQGEEGEHVSIRDDFHRDIAIAFELVIQEHLDPWNLDLSKFAELYLKEARDRGIDLVTAGRIILMAWTVLKLQSDEIAERAVFMNMQPEEEELDWDAIPDWDLTDDEWDYTERIKSLPQAPIDEKIRHKGDRRVTLMELIGAFEEVHSEAEERKTLNEQKVLARTRLKRQMRGRVGSMMHREDLDAEIAETWQRVLDHPSHPIPFKALIEPDRVDLVQTFNAILFLAKSGRIAVTQEDFPYGEIWLTPRLEEAAAIIEEEAKP